MKLGEVFSGQVRGLTSEGNGVLDHPSGRVVFIPGAWPGEQVIVKITALKSQFAQSSLVSIAVPHPERRQPPCPFHGYGARQCGGCPWQFVSYPAQLAAKQQRVEQAISRIAPQVTLLPIMASASEWHYRNRAQLKTDGQHLGFVSPNTHQLAPIDDCLVLNEGSRRQFHQLRQQLPNSEWQKAAKRQWLTLDINESSISLNKRLPFAQANSDQNRQMQQWLHHHLAPLAKTLPVLELFAGSGNFTQVIHALGFDNITAVEGVADAVAQLQQQFPDVKALMMDLFQPEAMGRLLKQYRPEILVLDPPRDGLKSLQALPAKNNPLSHIFYISCDLATFSRDVQQLLAQGFRLQELQPLDLFPQTPHIELMGVLTRA